jgi:hypothetical protein
MSHLWIGLLLLIVLAGRQLRPRPVKRSLYTFPLLLMGYAIYLSSSAGVQTGEGITLFVSAALGGVVGLVQGRHTRVFDLNGVWMISGSFISVAIWLFSIPIRYIVHLGLIRVFDITVALTGTYAFVPFLFSVAGILLGRTIYLTLKYPDEFMQGASMTRRERRLSQSDSRSKT